MNSTNQIFNWSRFTAALRKELTENWRTLALISLGIYLWYSLSMIINNITEMNGHQSFNPFMFGLVAAILASLAFRKLGSKNGRVDLFTSPSSTTEKFVTNVLIYVIGAFVMFALCFQLADVTRWAVMSLLNTQMGIESVAPTNFIDFFKMDLRFKNADEIITAQSFMFETIFVGSVFFLGSVLWPRRSLLKTATVLLVITLAKMIFLVILP